MDEILKEILQTLKETKERQNEAFTDMYRELREIKVRITEMNN
jgi:hypothetical protein